MIRTATIQDCHSVYSLICEMEDCKLDYETFEKIFAKMISCTDSYAILVAEKDNEVVGEILVDSLNDCPDINSSDRDYILQRMWREVPTVIEGEG